MVQLWCEMTRRSRSESDIQRSRRPASVDLLDERPCAAGRAIGGDANSGRCNDDRIDASY